jgi:hypothetical protein
MTHVIRYLEGGIKSRWLLLRIVKSQSKLSTRQFSHDFNPISIAIQAASLHAPCFIPSAALGSPASNSLGCTKAPNDTLEKVDEKCQQGAQEQNQ